MDIIAVEKRNTQVKGKQLRKEGIVAVFTAAIFRLQLQFRWKRKPPTSYFARCGWGVR